MFRQFAQTIGADALVQLHPAELMALLELAWATREGPPPPLGLPAATVQLLVGAVGVSPAAARLSNLIALPVRWPHLIYAYMIENTRIYEIFRRVVHEFLHDEKLGLPQASTQRWLRNTEELFYRDAAPFSITTITSHIRSDMRASRRNAYQRMFGMDLNHGTDDGQPYPYVRADAANSEFVTTFEELLRELWIGFTNFAATAAARPTDDARIVALLESLYNMLTARRQGGNLSREEFVFVSMMSWFHLSVESDLPIILDLRANATSEEQRLFRIAQRVGLPAHGLTRSLFEIAEPMSRILIHIETGVYNNNPAAVPALYTPSPLAPPGGPQPDIATIITHWSTITGRDVKAGKVAVR